MVPRRKKLPGMLLLVTVGARPELSVTTGLVQVTDEPEASTGTSDTRSDGQDRISGTTLSTGWVEETEGEWVMSMHAIINFEKGEKFSTACRGCTVS